MKAVERKQVNPKVLQTDCSDIDLYGCLCYNTELRVSLVTNMRGVDPIGEGGLQPSGL